MQLKISKLLSYVLHPVFMPTYLILLLKLFAPLPLFYSFFSIKSFTVFIAIIFVYTAIFPILLVLWLNKTRSVSDIEISNTTERPKVYLITSGFFISLGYFFYSKGGLLEPTAFLVAIMVVNILGLAIFSLKEKVSAHASALACILAVVATVYIKFVEQNLYLPILGLILLLGLLASSRLVLGAHTLKQVALGVIWGVFTGTLGAVYLL
ncbi:MAG TPA: hypothetical protein VK175_02220 [Leadbetterella sp.]|nr:hypothetical protein [Leadbetterella sp.]